MTRTWLISLALAVLVAGLYWRVGQFEFNNYDDPDYVTENPHVQDGLTRENVAWAFGRLHGERTYWHPVTWLSHMLDCQLFGFKAGAHHWVNVIFHAANTLLLFALLKKMTGAIWRSAMVAALFALHPLQVDTVAWVTERKNVLSAFFWMLTLGAYVRYAARPRLSHYLLTLAFYILGLMSKPVLVTLPCVMLLLDFWPLNRLRDGLKTRPVRAPGLQRPATEQAGIPHWASRNVLWLLLEKIPFFALALASSLITVQGHRAMGMVVDTSEFPLVLRIENAIVSYQRYLVKAVWPSRLAILYPHPGAWPLWQVVGSGLLLAAVTAVVIRALRRSPGVAVGWLWFLGVLVPTIGIVQAGGQPMADRFAYLPLIGLFVMVVWGLSDFLGRWPRQHLAFAFGAGAALLSLAVCTSIQLGYWRNSLTLFQHAVEVTTNNFPAQNNLAIALAMAGKREEALAHASEAVRIQPKRAEGYHLRGLILELQQNTAEAIRDYQEAIRRRPGWTEPLKSLGNLLTHQGQTADAIEQYRQALKFTPEDPEIHSRLAQLLAGERQTTEAIAHYHEALRLRPNWPEALNNLAWLLATHPSAEFRNGAEAVQLAERACKLTSRRQVLMLGTLAAAYAEAGQFDKAMETAQSACDLANTLGETVLAGTNQKLLEKYRRREPHRDPQ